MWVPPQLPTRQHRLTQCLRDSQAVILSNLLKISHQISSSELWVQRCTLKPCVHRSSEEERGLKRPEIQQVFGRGYRQLSIMQFVTELLGKHQGDVDTEKRKSQDVGNMRRKREMTDNYFSIQSVSSGQKFTVCYQLLQADLTKQSPKKESRQIHFQQSTAPSTRMKLHTTLQQHIKTKVASISQAVILCNTQVLSTAYLHRVCSLLVN